VVQDLNDSPWCVNYAIAKIFIAREILDFVGFCGPILPKCFSPETFGDIPLDKA
jgi:hypothetical protein